MKKMYMVMAWIGLLCTASFALAANGGSARENKPPPPTPTAPAAQQKVNEASTALNKAHTALQGIIEPLRKAFEASPEYVAAVTARKDAATKLGAAKTAALAALQASADYVAAVDAKKTAEDTKDTVMRDESATMEQKMAAANAVLDAGKAISAMENDILSTDSGYQDAKQKLVSASAAVDKLMAAFDASVKDKPEFQQAKAAIDTAQGDLDKAKQDLAAAQQADAAANLAYQDTLAAWQKQVLSEESHEVPINGNGPAGP